MGFVDIYDGCDGSEVIRYFFTGIVVLVGVASPLLMW